jgi:hypothetical protein
MNFKSYLGKGICRGIEQTSFVTINWTSKDTSQHGCSDLYFSHDWTNKKEPNACWRRGEYLGPKLLGNIVGFGGEMEQITTQHLRPVSQSLRMAQVNAPKHGFVRTVSDESWHWEFRRVEALELGAAGLFKIAGVEDHA